jgi:transposase InsO family protein
MRHCPPAGWPQTIKPPRGQGSYWEGQPRSSQRYEAQPRDDEEALVKRMRALAGQRQRFGYRRIAALLRREGWQASHTACCVCGVAKA